jgi:tRNA threonylcarbamoyladenosine biosynthesis protein TsaB
VVRRAGVGKREIDAVAVTQGPGSFTGLRIGVTCAKTLAWVLGWRAVGVPTLHVLVQNVDPAEHINERGNCPAAACPLLDARRSFVYGNVFVREGGRWRDSTGLLTGPPAQVASQIPDGALIFGSGVDAYPEVFRQGGEGAGRFRVAPESLASGRARHTARLGLQLLREGADEDPLKLVARYYRRTEAEQKVSGRP